MIDLPPIMQNNGEVENINGQEEGKSEFLRVVSFYFSISNFSLLSMLFFLSHFRFHRLIPIPELRPAFLLRDFAFCAFHSFLLEYTSSV